MPDTGLAPDQPDPLGPANTPIASGPETAVEVPIWELTLLVGQREVTLSLVSHSELSLGRDDKGSQAILPDVDLNPYGAYQLGVSRIHASLQETDGRIMITDLGSANGTYVNGRQIAPNTPHPLKTGDRFRLGELESFISIPSPPNAFLPDDSGYNSSGGSPGV